MTKFNTISWFLKRPAYYPQVFQILRRRKNWTEEQTRDQSTEWCKKNQITQQEAFETITGRSNFDRLDKLFPEEISQAETRVNQSGIQMGGEGAVSLIYNLLRHLRPNNCLETGVAFGWSSLSILLAIQSDPNAKLISNDMPYVNTNKEDFVGLAVPDRLKSKWELQRLPDITGIPRALKKLNQSIDFVHYDSDKSYTGRTWATPVLWKALNKGGIMMIDDINDNTAFKEFCDEKVLKPIIIEHNSKYVGILIKE